MDASIFSPWIRIGLSMSFWMLCIISACCFFILSPLCLSTVPELALRSISWLIIRIYSSLISAISCLCLFSCSSWDSLWPRISTSFWARLFYTIPWNYSTKMDPLTAASYRLSSSAKSVMSLLCSAAPYPFLSSKSWMIPPDIRYYYASSFFALIYISFNLSALRLPWRDSNPSFS